MGILFIIILSQGGKVKIKQEMKSPSPTERILCEIIFTLPPERNEGAGVI